MDDVLCAFSQRHSEIKAAHPEIEYPQSQVGFFRALKPIEGGIEAIQRLQAQPEFEVYILTAPSVINVHCYTEKRQWVEDHLGFSWAERLIISPHKNLNQGHYLIDDHTSGKGQNLFGGELLHFGSDRFPNWATVLQFFELLPVEKQPVKSPQ